MGLVTGNFPCVILHEPRHEFSCAAVKSSRNATLVTTIWPGLLEAWLALTSVKYHGNLYILIPLNQRLALTRLRATGPWLRSWPPWHWRQKGWPGHEADLGAIKKIACITSGKRGQAGSERGAPNTRVSCAPCSLHDCLRSPEKRGKEKRQLYRLRKKHQV